MATVNPFQTLLDLDARHDDLLQRLEDLDKRVARVLADYQPRGEQAKPSASAESVPTAAADATAG
jgi:hypothetical protein